SERYPVLYMQDGENVFDPRTSFAGVDWQIDETADRLIREKKIPPLIVVGIYNTADRTSEYSPGGMSSLYMDFVVDKLKPFIDRTYRTKPDRKNTMVGGSSSGGIFSFMLVWEHPDVFSKAICMSPAFATPKGMRHSYDYAKTVANSPTPPMPVYFYVDIGGIGLDSELRPGVDEMLTTLKQKHIKFDFVSDPNARHSEADWAKRFPNALERTLSR
ncbi:MAG TPA: alpha/beta hydrolase-fold protein, partial [Fimbriimonas sp.]|nr:alpha/beta hydrolase-fold protein [Fimbriimonas sp.]